MVSHPTSLSRHITAVVEIELPVGPTPIKLKGNSTDTHAFIRKRSFSEWTKNCAIFQSNYPLVLRDDNIPISFYIFHRFANKFLCYSHNFITVSESNSSSHTVQRVVSSTNGNVFSVLHLFENSNISLLYLWNSIMICSSNNTISRILLKHFVWLAGIFSHIDIH